MLSKRSSEYWELPYKCSWPFSLFVRLQNCVTVVHILGFLLHGSNLRYQELLKQACQPSNYFLRLNFLFTLTFFVINLFSKIIFIRLSIQLINSGLIFTTEIRAYYKFWGKGLNKYSSPMCKLPKDQQKGVLTEKYCRAYYCSLCQAERFNIFWSISSG